MLRQICIPLWVLSLFTAGVFAQTMSVGTGPYPAIVEGDPGAPDHTIYRPGDLSPFNKENPMPVVAWGNGACSSSSRMHANFLAEIASHGFLVVALGPYKPAIEGAGQDGPMGPGGGTKSVQMLEAIDWAAKENKNKESNYHGKLDLDKVAVAGMSCGGLQALEVSPDPRVRTTLVMNSGILNAPIGSGRPGAPPAPAPQGNGGGPGPGPGGIPIGMPAVGKDLLEKLHAPVIYIIGGESDIAYPNAIDDYARIDSVPAAMANFDVGHGGTYTQPNGGEFGRVAGAWLKWKLKGDDTAGKLFTGTDCGLCNDEHWKFERKMID